VTRSVQARDAAQTIFRAALRTVDSRALVRSALADWTDPATLLAVGKAAYAMAAGVCDVCPVRGGLVVTKDGHVTGPPLPVEAREASHPVPDARSLAAGEALLQRADGHIILCVSGGASALAVAPYGVELAEKIAATRAIAAAGADIYRLNAVRKHLSRIKGGRLAAAARGTITALLLSDVIGDDPATIGSGPAAPDPTTYAHALAIAEPVAGVPPAVLDHLRAGVRGEREETPKSLSNVTLRILAGPDSAHAAAIAAAGSLGFRADGQSRHTGTVEALADLLVARARALAPGEAYIVSGEPTLRITGRAGRGGRAQHCALLAAAAGVPDGVAILCAGTDGTDGPTPDAGAVIDAGTAARAGDVAGALAAFDAGTALAAAGDLLTTGPTGTNLCDLYIVVAC
jgi:glycerate 2-kinase